jgi:fatty-acyl-CoA synthase
MPADSEWSVLGESFPATRLERQVAAHARARGDAVAIFADDRNLTWRELDARANGLAAALSARGLTKGDRVAWLGRNGAAFPILMVACRRAGFVLDGLNWRLPAHELATLLDLVPVKAAVGDPEFLAPLAAIPLRIETGAAFMALADPDARFAPVATEGTDPCAIFYTSGSSGLPKAVEFSLDAAERAVTYPTTLAFTSDSRLSIVAPLFHTAGWVWCSYALWGGMTAILLSAADPQRMIAAVADLKATHVQWQPTMLDIALEEQARAPRDLGSLRMVAYGSAPIAPELLGRAFAAFDCEFSQVYGLTESVIGIGHLPPSAHRRDWGTDGPPTVTANPGNAIRIVGEDGRDLPPRGVGEVYLSVSYPPPVYLKNEQRTAIARPDGWIPTRDMGWLDEEGFLRLVGRQGDMIITGGENVYPAEVENVIAQFPEVAEVAVAGRRDTRWGQAICAVVARRPGAGIDAAGLIARCRARMAHYKAPRAVIFVDRLPRNASGKVIRPELLKLIEAPADT